MALLCAANPAEISVDPDAGPAALYEVHHPLGEASGKVQATDGAARVLFDGSIEIQVRAPLSSFRAASAASAVGGASLESMLDAVRFPYVTVRALVPPPEQRPQGPTVETVARVKIDLLGKTRVFPAKLKIAYYDRDRLATVSGQISIQLPDFDLVAPASSFSVPFVLAFVFYAVPAGRPVPLAFDLALTPEQNAGR
jgi:hypothetical protein